MSSPYPPMVYHPQHADENPTVLTIRRVEAADANGSRLITGENASVKLLYPEGSKFGTTKSAGQAEHGGREEKSGYHQAEGVNSEAKWEKSRLRFGAGGYGAGSSVGGKLRSLHRGSKRTPYDRPATGRHATAGGSAAMAAASPSPELTVASRLRELASRFIYSSASYVVSALFKRAPPAIKAADESKHTGEGIGVEEGVCEETSKTTVKQIDLTSGPGPASQVLELVDAGAKPMDTEGRMLDIVQVEEILKQKTWSREQVNRLTKILQTRVSENDATNFVIQEVEKTEMQLEPKIKDSSPVQVARAYMGEQTTRPSGIVATAHKSSLLSTKVQPSPVRVLGNRYLSSPFSRNWVQSSQAVRVPKRSLAREDDMALMGPIRRVRQKTSTTTNGSPYSLRMTGLSKPPEMRTSSPPSQSTQTALKILETLEKLSPSPQGKFLKVSPENLIGEPKALEKFSPSSKGNFRNEFVGLAGISTGEHTPETSKAREKLLAQTLSTDSSPKSTELKSFGHTTFGGMNFSGSEHVKKSKVEAPSTVSESYNTTPALGKGFQMNALFEESNSDDEAKVQVEQCAFLESRDVSASHKLKEEAYTTRDAVVSCIAPDFSGSSLLDPLHASTPCALMLKSCGVPATLSLPDKLKPSVTAISREPVAAFHSFSPPPVAVESRSILLREPTFSPSVAAEVKLSVEEVVRIPNVVVVKPLSPPLSARQTEATAMTTASMTTAVFLSTSSELATTAISFSASDGTTAPASSGVASTDAINVLMPPIPITFKTGMGIPEVENAVTTMVTESPVAEKLAEVDTMATDSMAEEADTLILAQSASSIPSFLSNAIVQPSTGSTFSFVGMSSTSSSVGIFPFGAGLGTASSGVSSSSSASSFAFGSQSNMASFGQASDSLLRGSDSSSSAAFAYGGHATDTLKGQGPTFSMGVSASSSSATSFTFGDQLGATPVGQAPSSVGKPSVLLDRSSKGSTGQAPSFGALSSSPANPFSSTAGNSGSLFMFGSSSMAVLGSSNAPVFGSSAMSSTSSVLTASSSGLSNFGASSSFQFGVPAGPSPSMSTASLSSFTANSFTSSLFSSSSAPTLSTTPAFSFGSSVASSSFATSAPFGSPFTFSAAQSNHPFAANPFSSSTSQSPSPTFNFGAAAMAATPSSLLTSGSTTSMLASNASPSTSNIFAFGSNSTPSTSSLFAFGSGQPATVQAPPSAPFAFGSQPAAVLPASGQPFGGQPAALAPNPFSAAGTAQPGPELTGGFSLGATSGDKSGRKYIKAKRTGSTKRGK